MTLDGQAYTGTSGDDANGTTKTPAELATQATWEALGFDLTGLWTWDADLSRPVLTQKAAQYTIRITEQPQDAIAFADRAAEFYVTANRGMGTLTYTWQYSADGKTWKNFKEQTAKLTVAAKLRMDGNQIRCQIKDEGGMTIYTNTVSLQVQDVDFDAAVAASALYARYQTGFVTTPKAPVSLYSLTGDISDCDVLIRYYDSYDVDAPNGRGMPGWALIDTIAQKGSLTSYTKSGVSVPSTTVNLLQETLDLQSANTNGAFFTKNTKKDGIFSNIIYTLAMDMYYDGGAWGNEKEDGTAGRTAAFNYLLSRLKDDTATDGRYFENLRLCNGNISAPGALRYNAEFVILMARFADDPALGKQALAALQDVLEMLNAQFDKGAMDVSTETTARYGSALVAAINVTNSKSLKASYTARLDSVFDKLENAWAKDGGYAAAANLTERAAQSDEAATAAAMMALADMANGKAVLAELSLRVPDGSVVASDLGMILLPSTALQDLTLPQAGAQGTQFTWASSNEAVISKDGKVTRPAQDTMVTLTVTGTYGEATQTHDFVITVPALRAAGGDEAYADLQNLSLLPEYIHDIDLPTQGENGSVITWASSNEAVISNDGKVTRPAIGQPDAHLTLTATASYGEASQSRTFEIKVWASVDTKTNDGMVKEAYYRSREYYYKTPVLKGYWDTWAGYAALGEELWERGYIYDTESNSEAQKGAQILGIVAIGENPYNYNGVNYVKRLQDAGYGGPYAVPVYNMLARDAAGIMMEAG